MATGLAPRNPSPDFGAHDLRRLLALAEREGLLLGGHRRSSLPPPIDCCSAKSAGKMRQKHVECAVLEEIVKSALFNLHSVENSLAFWDSKSEETHHRKMYYMTFERGPKVFAEMACQALRQIKNPYKFLLDSAHDMNRLIDVRMNALTNIQHCLATFLTEIFSEIEASRVDFHENSTNPLLALFTVVNTLYKNLGPALKSAVGKDLSDFGRVQLVDVESSEWTVDLAMDAISLIYKNIQKFDRAISSELILHGKPRSISMFWLPYTCGTIAFVGCSVWLLRNSSLEGTKQILTGIWNAHVKKPVISIRDELADSVTGNDNLEKRREEVCMMENSLTRQMSMFLKNSTGQIPSDLSQDELLKYVFKSHEEKLSGVGSPYKIVNTWTLASDPDMYRALLIKIDKHALRFQQELLRVSQHIKRLGLNFAILEVLPAVGVFAFLVRLAHTYGRGAAQARTRARKTAIGLLLATIEIDKTVFEEHLKDGEQDGASCMFGMMVYKIDNLFTTIEPNARELREWQWLRNDLINLARRQTSPEERASILGRLKFSYQSTKVV